jgi:hypothetical protein
MKMITKDKLFRVKIDLWRTSFKGCPSTQRETHIRASDLAHAKRITNRLFGTLGVTVEPVEGRFKRFPEFNR